MTRAVFDFVQHKGEVRVFRGEMKDEGQPNFRFIGLAEDDPSFWALVDSSLSRGKSLWYEPLYWELRGCYKDSR